MNESISSRKVVDLPIDDILPNRYQPRIKFEDSSIFQLADSIKSHGVFQPILVRPIGDKYEIIAGERRYKASVLANKTTIPAIIMSLNDKDTVEIALIENVQRSDLTPIEEAISYKKILDMGYIKQEDLARKLGKTQSTIANKLRLLNLDEDVQEALLENKISERHARSLLRLKNSSDQKIMLKRIINERLTVRKTDEEIEKMVKDNENNYITPVVIEMPKADIPSEPIINDTEDFNTNNSINGSTVLSSDLAEKVENVEINNLDVDAIEKNAAPIYEEKPKEVKIDELLTPEPEVKESPEPEEIEIESMPAFSGKFFNFDVSDVIDDKEEVNPDTSLNFNNYTPVEPSKEESQTPSFDEFFSKQSTVTFDDDIIPNNTANEFKSDAVIKATPDSKNVMDAVSIIREAASKLEAMGFNVDVDEMDLESIYQLIIKIEK